MARTVTWLPLSDLHMCEPLTGWDARRVLRSLSTDLKKMEDQHGLRPDMIFFTGDLTFGNVGKNAGENIGDQFRAAQVFIEGVRNSFSMPVPEANLFIVPGNHDIDRNVVTRDQTEWLDNCLNYSDIEKMIHNKDLQWQRNMERLAAYRQFLQDLNATHLLLDPARLIHANVREFSGVKVGIAGLNSGWSCCRNGEKGRLWLGGRWQIDNLLRQLEEAQFSIALIHHPVGWFREEEEPLVFRDIEREFAFCLHGHEHQGWVNHLSDGHVRIAAAACYDRSDRENGYSLVRLDLETSKGQVWLREYERYGGEWIPRLIGSKTNHEGVWQLQRFTHRLHARIIR